MACNNHTGEGPAGIAGLRSEEALVKADKNNACMSVKEHWGIMRSATGLQQKVPVQ